MPVQFAGPDVIERRTGDELISAEVTDEVSLAGHTPVYLPGIPDNNLRDLMERWTYSLTSHYVHAASTSTMTAAHRLLWSVGSERQTLQSVAWISPSEELVHSPDEWDTSELTAEQAISRVIGMLNLPKRDVLAAAGVAPTTYYYWKRSATRSPRLTSTGRTWRLVQAIEDLHEILGRDLNSWLSGNAERRKDLRAGRFDKLNAEALAERTPQDGQALRIRPSESVGVEDVGPRIAQAKPLQGRVVRNSGTITRHNA